MSVAYSQLIGGPAKTLYGATDPFWAIDDEFGLVVNPAWKAEKTQMFGTSTKRLTNATCSVGFTPYALWQSLPVLLPAAFRNPTIGSLLFSGTDTALKIWSNNGDLFTLTRAAITKPPPLRLGPDQDLFGALEFTGIVGNGMDLETPNSLYAIQPAQVDPGGVFAKTNFHARRWTAAWGALTGFTAMQAETFWELLCNVELQEVKIQGLTVNYKVKGVSWMVKGRPVGPTAPQIETAHGMQGTNNPQGRLLHTQGGTASTVVPDLVLTSGAKSITLNQAGMETAGFQFGDVTLRNGEVGWVTTTEFTAGVPQALVVITD